ncbi:hypothetical protein OSSY52_00480 [Tepiditoga spiralis]|uniref:Uncharacterized protein n=1 Tax=Tepiditoga spiralis TaxID=2108365 RepID=A0A7G1G4V3_9BACT|nr:hypothetical protein [Tepiditoga spiralis]BBE29907.1 hypothetical protein OSSY52_00480 [Tepiditoga spiralis]
MKNKQIFLIILVVLITGILFSEKLKLNLVNEYHSDNYRTNYFDVSDSGTITFYCYYNYIEKYKGNKKIVTSSKRGLVTIDIFNDITTFIKEDLQPYFYVPMYFSGINYDKKENIYIATSNGLSKFSLNLGVDSFTLYYKTVDPSLATAYKLKTFYDLYNNLYSKEPKSKWENFDLSKNRISDMEPLIEKIYFFQNDSLKDVYGLADSKINKITYYEKNKLGYDTLKLEEIKILEGEYKVIQLRTDYKYLYALIEKNKAFYLYKINKFGKAELITNLTEKYKEYEILDFDMLDKNNFYFLTGKKELHDYAKIFVNYIFKWNSKTNITKSYKSLKSTSYDNATKGFRVKKLKNNNYVFLSYTSEVDVFKEN